MKKIVLAGMASAMMLTACKKTEPTTAVKSIEQEKLEYQAKQLELERQKLAIEKERIEFEKVKDSLAKAQPVQATVQPIAKAPAKVVEKSEPKVITKTVYRDRPTTSKSNSTGKSGTYASNSKGSENGTNTYPVAQQPQRKTMTKAAKGTIIGTVGGAAAGAIINKKDRGAGAVIGGIVGGVTGYTIGRSQDKKEGNVRN